MPELLGISVPCLSQTETLPPLQTFPDLNFGRPILLITKLEGERIHGSIRHFPFLIDRRSNRHPKLLELASHSSIFLLVFSELDRWFCPISRFFFLGLRHLRSFPQLAQWLYSPSFKTLERDIVIERSKLHRLSFSFILRSSNLLVPPSAISKPLDFIFGERVQFPHGFWSVVVFKLSILLRNV